MSEPPRDVELKIEDDLLARAMFQVKTNLPEHPGGVMESHTVRVDRGIDPINGLPIAATIPVWEELRPCADT